MVPKNKITMTEGDTKAKDICSNWTRIFKFCIAVCIIPVRYGKWMKHLHDYSFRRGSDGIQFSLFSWRTLFFTLFYVPLPFMILCITAIPYHEHYYAFLESLSKREG